MENLIESNPKIMFGKPVIKGTRITVELILGKIADGETVDTILSAYPHLTREQVLIIRILSKPSKNQTKFWNVTVPRVAIRL